MFVASRAVNPLRKGSGIASLGTTMDSNFEEGLLETGVSMIFLNLERMALGSVVLDGIGALFSLVEASATEVTPTIGTWGGGAIPDGIVTNGVVVT